MEVVVKTGQTLADIALQEYGVLEAVLDLAILNGKSLTEELTAGEQVGKPGHVYNRVMENYCKVNEVSPATEPGTAGIGYRYQGGVGYMCVGIDFKVS